MKRELFLSRETIQAKVQEIARAISFDYAGKEPVMIGILNGVVFFFTDLIIAMSIPSKMDFMRASSYGSGMISSGKIKLTKDVEIPLAGKPVIVVEDIVDTGLTLSRIVEIIRERDPDSVKICALIDKLKRREREVPIDYCGFKVEKGFLVGYGLDHDEQYRYLPDIYVLK